MGRNIDFSGYTEYFFHVRIITGVFVSLCISKILSSFVLYIQKNDEKIINITHFFWLLTCSIFVVDWWWDVLTWGDLIKNSYFSYIFIILYAFSFYFLSSLLSPDTSQFHEEFDSYFMKIGKWFFVIFIINQIAYDFLHLLIINNTYSFSLDFILTAIMAAIIFISNIFYSSFSQKITSLAIFVIQIILVFDDATLRNFWSPCSSPN